MFKWIKKGRIFKPNGEFDWMQSHAQGPTVIEKNNCLRIYFATRPLNNISLPAYIDVEKETMSIKYIHPEPILKLGGPGEFDEHGIIPDEIIRIDNKIYLYYIGWSRRTSIPYSLSIGLAISEDEGNSFYKKFSGPILGIEKEDSYSVTAPCVYFENGMYYLFYTSGLNWFKVNNRYEHTYTVRCATSTDGIHWKRDFKNIIEPLDEFEAISNPTVIKLDNKYHMWFSYKGSFDFRGGSDSYRIGYAISNDLYRWTRKDLLSGINTSKSGWDSEMIEYPHVKKIGTEIYLFYNGNGFGQSGFGYAVLKN